MSEMLNVYAAEAEARKYRDMADAERYRALRASGKFCPAVSGAGWALAVGGGSPSSFCDLDKAADAAIATQRKEPGA